MTNPMAHAWLTAAEDLQIRVVHPFEFRTRTGAIGRTMGVYLPDFGSPNGTIVLSRFDPDDIEDLIEDASYFSSGLNPRTYEPYKRQLYIQTLSDWGWYGTSASPTWYDPSWRAKV
jgi:hypothetical protein